IIIEQPLYYSETATTTFLTTAQVQQIIQQQSFELIEISITPEAETDEMETTEEVVITPEETIVCGRNEELVNGVCHVIPEPSVETKPEPTPPPVVMPEPEKEEVTPPTEEDKDDVIFCSSNEELVNGVCQAKPPVCGSNEELVNGACQTKPPVCNDNETLVDGVCQVTPSEEDEVLDNQNPSETLDENDHVLDTEHQDEN
ncbi:MAG: hypothetical protein ACRC6H_01410, partial [Culicoidibacterales bacterium]